MLADPAARAPARFAGDGVPDYLIAEAGFSALVRFEKGGRERTLLPAHGLSGNGFRASAGSTCAVTQTGVVR